MRNLEAHGERSVVVGRDVINSLIVTGDCNKIFIGKYETLLDAYIYPGEVFRRVDIEHFVGREWLLNMVDSFLLNHDQGYFILESEAGFGKTAFLAWLIRKRGYIHNFCELTPGLNNIGDGLKNLASQLALAYDLIDGDVLPTDVASRPDYLYGMLEKAAEQRENGEKIVLVVDALDEAGTLKGQNVLGLPKVLPKGVFIVVSQRSLGVTLNIDTAIISHFVCRLSDYKEKNEDDIRRFLYDATTRPRIAALLKEQNCTSGQFVTTLIEKCQGVWIYLHYVIPEIESGERLISDLDSLPEGLLNYYLEYWARWRKDDQWDENYLPLLATLAASQESISVEKLAVWSGSMMPVPKLRRLLKEQWRSYLIVSLHDEQERYRFYHQSLQDLFNGRVKRENLRTAVESFLDELKKATLEAHNRLVKRYLTAWGGSNDGLPALQNHENITIDSGYGLRYLTVHLEASRRIDELHRLLSLETTERRNAWYKTKEAYGTVTDYMIDVARAWQLVKNESESMIKKEKIAPSLGMETRYALISASINSLSLSIPPNLLVALVQKGIWTLNKGLAYAQQIPRLEMRVESLISIIHNLPESLLPESQKEDILKKALDAATQIPDEENQGKAFVKIAPLLPESMMKESLEAVTQIQNGHYRAITLAIIAPRIPESMIEEALDEAIRIRGEYSRAVALAELSFHRSEPIIKKALDAAMQIQDHYSLAEALIKIALSRPNFVMEEVLKDAFNAAMRIQNEFYRAKTLAKIYPHLTKLMMKDALNAAIQIQDPYYRVIALDEMASCEAIKDAFNPATQIQDPYYRVIVDEMASCEAIKDAFNAATQIQEYHHRAIVFFKLAFHLPKYMKKEAITYALDAAMQIPDEKSRSKILVELVPYLPKSRMKNVVDTVIKIPNGYSSAIALIKTAPHPEDFVEYNLPEDLVEYIQKETLNAVIQIQIENYRAEAFVKIAPYLSKPMMKEALDAAIQIQDGYSRAIALTEIAFRLPESMVNGVLNDALDATTQIQDQYYLVKALVKIAPYLPESLRRESLKEALETATKIRDQYLLSLDKTDQVLALAEIAEIAYYLPESMMKKLLDATIQIQLEYYRVEILVKIAPYLPKYLMNELLDAVTHVQDESDQAKALIGISSYIPEYLTKEILDVAMQIRNEYYRAEVLAKISLNLSGSVLKEKSDVANQIQDNSDRAKALTGTASHLPESMIKEALDEAMQIQNDSDRAEALTKIVPLNVNIFSLDSLYVIWMKILHGSTSSRGEVFTNLGDIMPLIYKLGEEKAMTETFHAIQDVARWWP